MQKVSKDIEVVIKKVIDSFGYDLWGVEFFLNNKSGPLLRIYIEVEGGVDISHCEKVSRQLSAVLDVEKVIKGEYTLEVSSPGLDRPLFTENQLKKYIDKEVQVKLIKSQLNRRNFCGIIKDIEDGNLEIMVDGKTKNLAIDNIEKAKLVPDFQMENKT